MRDCNDISTEGQPGQAESVGHCTATGRSRTQPLVKYTGFLTWWWCSGEGWQAITARRRLSTQPKNMKKYICIYTPCIRDRLIQSIQVYQLLRDSDRWEGDISEGQVAEEESGELVKSYLKFDRRKWRLTLFIEGEVPHSSIKRKNFWKVILVPLVLPPHASLLSSADEGEGKMSGFWLL